MGFFGAAGVRITVHCARGLREAIAGGWSLRPLPLVSYGKAWPGHTWTARVYDAIKSPTHSRTLWG